MLQRRFLVQGSCSKALASVAGYPEGDLLSVAPMLVINVLTRKFVLQRVGIERVISYVDTW